MDHPQGVNAALRKLPGVDRLIEAARQKGTGAPWSLHRTARDVVDEARAAVLAGAEVPPLEVLVDRVRIRARELEIPAPRRVLNVTGIVLHTNLARAPLAAGAATAVADVAQSYTDLELDLSTGERGSRTTGVTTLLEILSGAEAAHVVNNTAAALFLVVDTLAAGREVVLSRGELVEIGGSFRVPEILGASRARLKEIGTTNRTHLEDYRNAIDDQTGMLLKVHRSNFEIRGFTSEVTLRDMAALGTERGVPVVEDRGSGTFVDLRPYGLPEREAHAGLREGADLVLFSGDKLLGGPQAGIILGRRSFVEKLRKNPLSRALRVDKLTLAALDWTLRALLGGRAVEEIPVLQMVLLDPEELKGRAERLAAALRAQGWVKVSVDQTPSPVGGGALPDVELPGIVVRLEPEGSVDALARQLRHADPPVVARVHKGAILLDPRTLKPGEVEELAAVFATVRRGSGDDAGGSR